MTYLKNHRGRWHCMVTFFAMKMRLFISSYRVCPAEIYCFFLFVFLTWKYHMQTKPFLLDSWHVQGSTTLKTSTETLDSGEIFVIVGTVLSSRKEKFQHLGSSRCKRFSKRICIFVNVTLSRNVLDSPFLKVWKLTWTRHWATLRTFEVWPAQSSGRPPLANIPWYHNLYLMFLKVELLSHRACHLRSFCAYVYCDMKVLWQRQKCWESE